LGPLLNAGSVESWQGNTPPPRDELLARVAECDALICMLTDDIDAEVLAAAPRLKVIGAYSVSTENIDLAAATDQGICVCTAPGILTDATADLTWALLLSAARRVVEGDTLVRSGAWAAWDPQLLLGMPLYERTLGLLGMGRVGRAVARRAVGFDMRILYHARHRDEDAERSLGVHYVDFDTLLSESDFLSIHTAVSPETRGLIGAGQLAGMKPTAVLVSTARGSVVDQRALTDALGAGKLFAAGLDVYDEEPLPPEDPLCALPNVVLLPHLGSSDVPTRENMARAVADGLLDVLYGRVPAHLANPDVWDHRR
jgi:glyoxylate reductase